MDTTFRRVFGPLFIAAGIMVSAVAIVMAISIQTPTASAQGTLPATPTPVPTSTPVNTPVPPPTPTPFPTPAATPVVETGATQSYVTSQRDSTIADPTNGVVVNIPKQSVTGQAFVSVKSQTVENAPSLPTGARFSSAQAFDVTFKDTNGAKITKLPGTVRVSFPFTLAEFGEASLEGFRIFHLSEGSSVWEPLFTSVDVANRRAFADTDTFSTFALTIVQSAQVPPGAGEPTSVPGTSGGSGAQLPSVGGTSPSGSLIVVLLLGGIGMVATGSYMLKRRKQQGS